MASSGERHSDIEKLVAESVAQSLPAVLQGLFASHSLPGQNEPKLNVNTVTKSVDVKPVPTTSPGDRLYISQSHFPGPYPKISGRK